MVFGEQSFAGTSCASDAAGSQHAAVHNALSTSSSRRAAIGTPEPRTREIIDPGPLLSIPGPVPVRAQNAHHLNQHKRSRRVSGDALGIVHHAHYSPTPPTIAPAHRRGLPTRAVSNCRATPQTPHEPPRRAQARDAQRAATPLQGDDLQAGATHVRRRSSALLAVHGSRTHRRAPCIARERAPVAERIPHRTWPKTGRRWLGWTDGGSPSSQLGCAQTSRTHHCYTNTASDRQTTRPCASEPAREFRR
jgi:hypothetical protein